MSSEKNVIIVMLVIITKFRMFNIFDKRALKLFFEYITKNANKNVPNKNIANDVAKSPQFNPIKLVRQNPAKNTMAVKIRILFDLNSFTIELDDDFLLIIFLNYKLNFRKSPQFFRDFFFLLLFIKKFCHRIG